MKLKYLIDFPALVLFIAPIINAVADVTTNFFSPVTLNPGSLRFIFLTIFMILLFFNKIRTSFLSLYLLILLIFFFLNTLFSNDYSYSINSFLSTSLALSAFWIGYTFCDSKKRLHYLFVGLLISLIILNGNYIISQLFRVGSSIYIEDSFYIGGAGVGLTAQMSILLGVLPYFFYTYKDNKIMKSFFICLTISTIIIVILVFRRTAIIILMLCLFAYMVYTSKNRFRSLMLGAMIMLMIAAVYPLYGDLLQTRLDARNLTERSLEDEGRYEEFSLVYNMVFSEGEVSKIIFGYGMFDHRGIVGSSGLRPLHVGYLEVLHGTGILGLVLFLFYHLKLYTSARSVNKTRSYNDDRIFSIYIWIFVGITFFYIFGRISSIGLGYNSYLMLGSLLIYMKKDIK